MVEHIPGKFAVDDPVSIAPGSEVAPVSVVQHWLALTVPEDGARLVVEWLVDLLLRLV